METSPGSLRQQLEDKAPSLWTPLVGMRPLNWVRMGYTAFLPFSPLPPPTKDWEGGRRLGSRQVPGTSPCALPPPGAPSRRPTWMGEGLPPGPAGRERTGTGLAHGCAPRRAPKRPPETRSGRPAAAASRPSLPEPGFQVPAWTSQRPGRGAECALPTPAPRWTTRGAVRAGMCPQGVV